MELETSPAVASLGLGLTSWRGRRGVLGPVQRRLGRDREALWCPRGPEAMCRVKKIIRMFCGMEEDTVRVLQDVLI